MWMRMQERCSLRNPDWEFLGMVGEDPQQGGGSPISGPGSAAGGTGLVHPVVHQLESTKPTCLETVSPFTALSWRSSS